MNRFLSLTVAIVSAAAFCLVADVANAQVLRRRVVPMIQTDASAQSGQTAAQRDRFLADWIGADNQTEIELNQFAGQRASNQEVKDFSQEMIRAHRDLANKLNQAVAASNAAATNRPTPYAAGYRGMAGTTPAQPGTPSTNASQGTPAPALLATAPQNGAPQPTPGATGNQPGAPATMPATSEATGATVTISNPANFKRDVNAQLVTLIEEKLGQKEGQAFDRCFVAGQIGGHLHMLATLEAAQKLASPQLKPVLDEAVTMAQQHLSKAESLLAKLEPRESR